MFKIPRSFFIELTRTNIKGKAIEPVVRLVSKGQGSQRLINNDDLSKIISAYFLNQTFGIPVSKLKQFFKR